MIELKILLAALVVWGLTHFIQLVIDRLGLHYADRLWYQLCNALRLLAIAVSCISFLVWVWLHMAPVIRSLCSL